jgi:hemerythrin-like metal-binding protein
MALPWKDEYNLGIVSIDLQHKKLIGIINTLAKNISQGLSPGDINSAIVRMEQYVRDHFLFEEKYFEMFQYEETDEHVAEHYVFLEKTEEFRKRAVIEDPNLSIEMLGYLEEWFIHHVLIVDRKYVEVFKRNGIK